MKKEPNYLLGGIVATVGALLGIAGHFILFQKWYFVGMAAESAEEGCEILLKYIHPALTDIGILGGVIFAVAAYGFFTRRKWAFFLSVIAIVLSLQGAWFISVPYMAADLPPVYFILFWPFLIVYFILMIGVGKIPSGRMWMGLLAGIAFVMCLMNGVSSLSRIITVGAPLFYMTQRLHWVAMAGCGVLAVGVIMQPREWMRVLGITASALELIVGVPLALMTARELGRFSLFALAPIASLILLVMLVWPGVWARLEGSAREKKPVASLVADPA